MDVVRLRKMTRKSVMGFGKYEDSTVGHLIDYQKTPYLRWVYYNNSNIDFMPDVLDEIHIPEEYRIPKPGKAPEMTEIVYQANQEKLSGLKKHIHKIKVRRSNRVKDRLIKMRSNESKIRLRAKNQWK